MYMDDIKLFAKNEKELETLIHAIRIYSQDIGMKFGIEKFAMLVIKSGKRHMTDGMELPSQDKIRNLGEKETYKYLGTLEADTIKQVEMKDKIKKEYLRRTRKLQKPLTENFIKGIDTWVVLLVRYLGTLFDAIRTNQIKARIDKTQQNSKCRLYVDRDETNNHIISKCNKLSQKEYMNTHE